MADHIESIRHNSESGLLFTTFCVWSFMLLCRPQDYLPFLVYLRPGLSLGVVTLLLYMLAAKSPVQISVNGQFRLYRYLILVLFISVPFSYYLSASLKDVVNYACITTIFFYLFYQLVNSIEKLCRLLFLFCTGVAVYSIYALISGDFIEGRIAFGGMFDPNDIAYFVISFLPFNMLFISKENKTYVRFIAFFNLIIGLIVVLKTGSRGGFIALIALSLFLIFVKTSTIKLSFFKKTALVILAISSLQFVNMNMERYRTILDANDDYNVTDEEGRLAIWNAGLRMMVSRPLTGVGMNRFNEGVGRDRLERGLPSAKWQTAHNSIVQIGAETGIFGLILFCMMSSNVFKITGQTIANASSDKLVKISEMTRAGFIGHFTCAMFLSQAYSIYWAFYIVLSAVFLRLVQKELLPDNIRR